MYKTSMGGGGYNIQLRGYCAILYLGYKIKLMTWLQGKQCQWDEAQGIGFTVRPPNS